MENERISGSTYFQSSTVDAWGVGGGGHHGGMKRRQFRRMFGCVCVVFPAISGPLVGLKRTGAATVCWTLLATTFSSAKNITITNSAFGASATEVKAHVESSDCPPGEATISENHTAPNMQSSVQVNAAKTSSQGMNV